MNNGESSTEELISNNFEEGEMFRNKKNTKQKMPKNKESIKPGLSMNVIYDVKQMKNFLESNDDKLVLKEALDQVNTEIKKKEDTNGLGPTKKQKCIDQRNTLLKTRDFLKKKIKSIGTDAKAAVSSVNDVSATTSSQAPVNIDDEKKQAQAHAQLAEHVPEESAKLKAQPSNTQEQQEVSETPVPEQTDDIESLSTQDALVPQSKSATVLSVDSDEEKQASLNDEVFYDVKESMLDTTNSRDGSTLEGDSNKQEPQPKSVPIPLVARDDECSSISSDASDASTIKAARDFEDEQLNSSPLLPQSSVSGDEHSGSSPSFINVSKSDEGDTDNSNSEVSSEDITKEDSSGRLAGEGDQQNSQPPLSSFDLSPLQRFVDDELSSIAGDLRSEASIEDDGPSLSMADDEYSEDSSIEDVTDEKEPLLDKTNKGDSTLKSSNSLQSTKSSKLPTVVTWTLAVAGVVSGVAIAVYLEMLAAVIAVGVCCLVAALIIYCCNRPSNSLEGSNVEPVANGKLVGQQ